LNSRKSDYDESSSQRSFKENRRRKLSDSTVGLPNRNKQDSTQNISYIQNGGQSRQSFTEQRFEHAPLVESPQTTILCMVEQAPNLHDIDAIITSYLQDYTTSTPPNIPDTTNSSRRFIPSSDSSSTSPHRQDTNVIRLLGTRKAYSSMLQFLRRQPQPHPSHAIYEYTAAISILGQAVDDPTYRSMAHGLFDEMIHLGITPNSYTCTALFLAIDGGKASWTWYQRIQQLYLQQERIVEVHVFNAAIFACSRPSKSRNAEEIQKQQEEEEDSGWQTALMIFNEMRKNKVIPNEQTFASLIHTCAKYGQVRVALSLLDEIKKKTHKAGRGQETNSKVWSAILSAFASAGDSNTVWTLILEMIQRGNRPHTLHYNSLLSALAREGKDTMALHVLNGMIHGTVESIVSHSTSLESIEQDMSVSNMTMKTGNHHMTPSLSRPDIVSFNTVMSALTQPGNKNYPEAKKLLELLKSGEYVNAYGEEVRPDIITYNTLLSACDEPKEAIEIIREVRASTAEYTTLV
jgi:pentatricopeptide repeat protein